MFYSNNLINQLSNFKSISPKSNTLSLDSKKLITFVKRTVLNKTNLRVLLYLSIVLFISFIFSNDIYAVEDNAFKTEFAESEKFLKQFARIGLIGGAAYAAIVGIIKQNTMLICICGICLVSNYLIGKWITTTYTAII